MAVELVFGAVGHVRPSVDYDENIDRAFAIQVPIGSKIKFLSYGTGQPMRACAAGLSVVKLAEPLGEEPK